MKEKNKLNQRLKEYMEQVENTILLCLGQIEKFKTISDTNKNFSILHPPKINNHYPKIICAVNLNKCKINLNVYYSQFPNYVIYEKIATPHSFPHNQIYVVSIDQKINEVIKTNYIERTNYYNNLDNKFLKVLEKSKNLMEDHNKKLEDLVKDNPELKKMLKM